MKRPLRILHIGNGGAFKIKAIANAFVDRGHDVHVAPVPPVEDAWPGVTWHVLGATAAPGKAQVAWRAWQLRRLVSRIRPDVVHAHNAWGPGWYGAFTGCHPFFIHAYGGDVLPERYRSRPALERQLTSWACRTADRVVVTGHHMIDASAGLGIPRDRLMLLPRGVDLDRYRPGLDTIPLRAEHGIDTSAPVMLSPRYQLNESLYNFDTIIEAFALVRAAVPAAVCVQMYDPRRTAERDRLSDMARMHGLGESYKLVPTVDNTRMPLYYNMASAVVSVPSTDGFPVTVLEASACEAPLVVSDLPYCGEWFTPGENGLIVPVRDPEALAGRVLDLFRDDALRTKLGRAGRRLVSERADYRKCMDALEHEYVAMVNARRQPA